MTCFPSLARLTQKHMHVILDFLGGSQILDLGSEPMLFGFIILIDFNQYGLACN